MKKLEIHLENCFGIGKLEHIFDFELVDSNSFLVYAPNGTMKSSFAKTLDLISKNDAKSLPSDRVYSDRITSYNVITDGNVIPHESILVVNAEDNTYDATSKISSFIASKDLKSKYDIIYSELEAHKKEYIKRLKVVSQSSDCETEFVNTYSNSEKETFFEILSIISKQLVSKPETYNFRYNDIFDKKGNVKKFLDKNQKLLSDYVTKYDELLKKSKFFRSSGNSFGTYQANMLLKSIEDNSYFEAGHKFTLSDNAEIKSAEELTQLLISEISSIVNDEKLRKSFDQVDKAIGSNVELRSFKGAIENDNLLLIELEKYEEFRKKVWLNYISALKKETDELVAFYESKKSELEKIITEAKKEFALWEEIIKTFNERFFVPFKVNLINQDDVILKEETANLEFDYKDSSDTPVRKDKTSLLTILSKGEQRAFFILQLLFDIESRKQLEHQTLLILDDIADSFDYKNKYAIIEYIRELHNDGKFKILILTHNFDFYRTVAKRLYLGRKAILMTLRKDDRSIILAQGGYLNDIFKHFKDNLSDTKVFVSIIPLVRNLIEYIEGHSSQSYLLFTSCLHIKAETRTITCDQILKLVQKVFPTTGSKSISFGSKLIRDHVYDTADLIENESSPDEIKLENKITLSIAIRLKAEEYMLSKIPNSSALKIESNQTSELLNHYKLVNTDKRVLSILDKVNLMTPENIHVNAFMYEPIIDISVFHLIKLYSDIKQLK